VPMAKMVNQQVVELRDKPELRPVVPMEVHLVPFLNHPEAVLELELELVVLAVMDHHRHKLMVPLHPLHPPMKRKNQLKNAQCNANLDHLDQTEAWVKKVHPDLKALQAPPVPMAKMVNQQVVELRDKPELRPVVPMEAHLLPFLNHPEVVLELELVVLEVLAAIMENHRHKLMVPRHRPMKRKNQLKNVQCNANPDHPDQTEEWVKKVRPDPKALQVLLELMANEANVVWLVTKLAPVHLANKDLKVRKEMMVNSIISMVQPDLKDPRAKTDQKDPSVHPEKTAIPVRKVPTAMWAKQANLDQAPNPADPVHPATKALPVVTAVAIIVHRRERLPVIKLFFFQDFYLKFHFVIVIVDFFIPDRKKIFFFKHMFCLLYAIFLGNRHDCKGLLFDFC